MSVRFIETWATPYSAMNQPIALTALRVPGVITGWPATSVTSLPVRGWPSRLGRPASRTSKAMALARRVEVVFKLTLNATRKSRAPMTVAPLLALKAVGPKSGFHAESFSLRARPSYSPVRMTARFFRLGSGWAAS